MSASDLSLLTLIALMLIVMFFFSSIAGFVLMAFLAFLFLLGCLLKFFTYLYKKAGLDD